MSWLYSRALVEEYLAESYLDGEQSAQSSGKLIPQAYCAPDKMTDFSKVSRYGMTFKPLTENLGEELLMSFRAAFHVKTSVLVEKEMASKAKEVPCGTKWRGWLAKYDLNTSLWKTPQSSLFGEEPESLETLPRWGMTVNGLLWEQPMLAPHTNATESGFLLPTPTASMMPCEGTVRIMRKHWQSGEFTLEEASAIAGKDVRKSQGKVQAWPTPSASMGNRGTQAEWTPMRKSGHTAQYTLNQALRDSTGKIGKPNPRWTEWLMGWPMGWTDLKPLVTDKSLCVQPQHGES
jgi:hypothetical protein